MWAEKQAFRRVDLWRIVGLVGRNRGRGLLVPDGSEQHGGELFQTTKRREFIFPSKSRKNNSESGFGC